MKTSSVAMRMNMWVTERQYAWTVATIGSVTVTDTLRNPNFERQVWWKRGSNTKKLFFQSFVPNSLNSGAPQHIP